MLKKFLVALGIAAVCALIAFLFFLYYMHKTGTTLDAPLSDFPGYQTMTITIDGQAIDTAVADTPALQELGLGNRAGIGANEGMIFIFPQDGEYAFWMKDMSFSIDMVWISSSNQIIYMAQDVSPQTYPENFVPTSPARYVLELNAGYAQAHNFKIGDAVQF